MAARKKIGRLDKIITSTGLAWVKANEKMEVISLWAAVRAREAGVPDLIPRIYAYPEGGIKVTARATLREGHVELWGLGGTEVQEHTVEVELSWPLMAVPPTPEQLEAMHTVSREAVLRRMKEVGLTLDGAGEESHFITDHD